MVYQSTSAHLSPSEPQSDLFLLPHSLGPRDQLLVVVNKDKDKVCVCVCVVGVVGGGLALSILSQ